MEASPLHVLDNVLQIKSATFIGCSSKHMSVAGQLNRTNISQCQNTAYHFIHLRTVVLLNISQNPDVIALHKIDGNTLQARLMFSQQPVAHSESAHSLCWLSVMQVSKPGRAVDHTLRPYRPDLPILWM